MNFFGGEPLICTVIRFEENIKTEISKQYIFKELFNQNNEEIKKNIINDYLINFLIKYLEVQKTDYIISRSRKSCPYSKLRKG